MRATRHTLWMASAATIFAVLLGWTLWRDPAGRPVREAYEIRAEDSGRTYEYVQTSRFIIVLNQTLYPPVNFELDCDRPIVLGRISNIPYTAPPFYAARFEAVGPGTCTVRNNSFHIRVRVI